MVFFINCQNRFIERDSILISKAWHKDSVLNFEINSKQKQIFFLIENTDDYPFNNLHLFVKMETKNGILICDTLEYLMADNYGRWLGVEGKNILEYNLPIEVTKINLQHGMRVKSLKGIRKIGLIIKNYKK